MITWALGSLRQSILFFSVSPRDLWDSQDQTWCEKIPKTQRSEQGHLWWSKEGWGRAGLEVYTPTEWQPWWGCGGWRREAKKGAVISGKTSTYGQEKVVCWGQDWCIRLREGMQAKTENDTGFHFSKQLVFVFFVHSDNLWLLIGEFSPFTFTDFFSSI